MIYIRVLCSSCAKVIRRHSALLSKWIDHTGVTTRSWIHTTAATCNQSKKIDLDEFSPDRIRNFSIIAHIDHGKSTLADRLLEYTGTISRSADNKQVLDKLQVERERGITVKAQTASLIYQYQDTTYLLNLIDTPGHVDFSYEVSRSLSACQGVVLLVDANQGVQAQTVANFYLAFERDLVIIPVLNKIDLKGARPDEVCQQMESLFDIGKSDILQISAKLGTGIDLVLKAIIERLPCPQADRNAPLKALIFDSWYDKWRGAISSIALIDGTIKKGTKIKSNYTGKVYEVQETGIMYPNEQETNTLYAGQVGYLICGMKMTKEAQIGDTIYQDMVPVKSLPGFKPAKPMVFAGIYPVDQSEYSALRSAIEKLLLNDSSVSVNIDSSAALGQGWRLGFLGLLHMDVFSQRLEQEYDASVIITSPNVPYKVKIIGAKNIKQYKGEEITILNPSHFPDPSIISECSEPVVLSTIITPDSYMGSVTSLFLSRRGQLKDQLYIDNKRIMFKVVFPLNEIIVDFFDELKSITSGYASFDYEDYGYESANLVKVDFALNGLIVDELAMICHSSKVLENSKRVVAKLKEAIPRQLFEIAIQAKLSSKILVRDTIKAYRKDVLAKCYGGDITRKMKLLRQQAEGKKKMKRYGNVDVPKDAFISVLKK
ncbi:hypothetical protein LSH36_48g03046 [Paralvinella palmiformis]|uniref:Translation factor GUF1 homolog, mitochondrial n=1 Tax=Paralvinella palmiformis TaxID=53620 RepID=A0AAD9K5Y4_9ANNE|nr:hypothetical protein LSH36_48g03046 [Paralvinella palmiformis]